MPEAFANALVHAGYGSALIAIVCLYLAWALALLLDSFGHDADLQNDIIFTTGTSPVMAMTSKGDQI
jgi:hypothetical protein